MGKYGTVQVSNMATGAAESQGRLDLTRGRVPCCSFDHGAALMEGRLPVLADLRSDAKSNASASALVGFGPPLTFRARMDGVASW